MSVYGRNNISIFYCLESSAWLRGWSYLAVVNVIVKHVNTGVTAERVNRTVQ